MTIITNADTVTFDLSDTTICGQGTRADGDRCVPSLLIYDGDLYNGGQIADSNHRARIQTAFRQLKFSGSNIDKEFTKQDCFDLGIKIGADYALHNNKTGVCKFNFGGQFPKELESVELNDGEEPFKSIMNLQPYKDKQIKLVSMD